MSSSPRLGIVRSSMLTNNLFIKPPLGKAQTRGHVLPGPDFTYGIKSKPNPDGGVAGALKTLTAEVEVKCEKTTRSLDFVAMNKNAVIAGLVTTKEQKQHRKEQPIIRSLTPPERQGRTLHRQTSMPDITHGIKNRVSSPLSLLISHEYGRRWLENELKKKQLLRQQKEKEKKFKLRDAAENKTSRLRRSRSLPAKPKPIPSCYRKQVVPALDTFRDYEAQERNCRAWSNVEPKDKTEGPETDVSN